MHTLRRYLTLAISATILVAAFATPALAGAESQFVSKINASRAAAGKAPLEVYWDLADDARAQSQRMAAKGEIFHNASLSSVTGVWMALGENVGVGADPTSLHSAFMNSAAHRNNILGDYNYIGVGVTTDASGLIWVTMVFMRAAPGLNGGGTTTTTAPPTTTTTAPPMPQTTTTTPPVTTTQPPAVPATTASNGSSAVGSSTLMANVVTVGQDLVVAFGRPGGLYPVAD
ncbi:MAG: CAP domain-containing protein [Actinomycetia bacterium]|nr:CAP domain-containing protein [Actinomycetes bacterium]